MNSAIVAKTARCHLIRPHYLRREGLDAGVYVRVGSTNRRADRELIEELCRFARGEAYDVQPMPELDSEALDFRAATTSARHRPLETVEAARQVPWWDSRAAQMAQPVVSTSAPPRCLDGGDVDLLHRHHRLEGTLCLTATSRKRLG